MGAEPRPEKVMAVIVEGKGPNMSPMVRQMGVLGRLILICIGLVFWVPFVGGLGQGLRAGQVSEPAILAWQVALSVVAGVLAITVLAGWVRVRGGRSSSNRKIRTWLPYQDDADGHIPGSLCACLSCQVYRQEE